ncbi:MAG: hypothetical protein HYX32_12115 [Actinobacteria bacterium]|nr:hypothetical protein [Actinomycetota bacterium]
MNVPSGFTYVNDDAVVSDSINTRTPDRRANNEADTTSGRDTPPEPPTGAATGTVDATPDDAAAATRGTATSDAPSTATTTPTATTERPRRDEPATTRPPSRT